MSKGRLARRADSAEEREAAPVSGERGIGHYVGLGLSAAILLVVVALAVVVIVVPKLTGSTPLTVLTSSMEPTLPPGTLLVVRPVDPDDIAVGDVVTYQIRSGEPGVITHRIISINAASAGGRSFRLQGDNNSDPDPDAISPDQMQGRVWYSVPLIGWVNNAVNGDNRGLIVTALAVVLFGYAGWTFASGVVSASKRKRTRGHRPARHRGA